MTDALDRGLAAAFGLHTSADSVLGRLGLGASVVLEAEAEDGPATVPLPLDVVGTAADEGRYEIRGEIGRGGVGVILRGRDVELGRDVAVKVLRPELAQADHVVLRFLEEAQIGGQLQHPGIAPVYDVGLLDDQRPYFAMKLVRGRTFGELLEDREPTTAGRRRFLQIFEQICQTVAYAHARGVIHRDLKPDNVMVGAFGEVQVMDWGFAKVLARGGLEDERSQPADETSIHTVRTESGGSASRLGSVMGTPAYMPPEQAKGQVDRVDERSDVFSLGAILLEILTGAPPYPVGRDTLVRAAGGELGDAFSRLDAARVDVELADLCRRCLAVEPGDRPQDAGVVAERVGDHLARLEERALAGAREAAAARVRARGERRARRLTIAIAAALVLGVVLGGGGLLWAHGERQAERARARGAFGDALAEVDRLTGIVESIEPERLDGWEAKVAAYDRALEAWHEAERLAPAAGTDAAGQLAARREALVPGRAAALQGAARAERDRGMVARLERIRGQEELGFDRTRSLLRAFRDHGLDVLQEDPDRIVEALGRSWIHRELVAGLESLANQSGGYDRSPSDTGNRVLEILRRADPDPIRQAVRDAGRRFDLAQLVELAEGRDPRVFEENVPNRIAVHMIRADGIAEARAFLEEALRRRRDSYWVNVQLAYELLYTEPTQPADAEGYLRAALAVRPDSVIVSRWLGKALDEQGRTEQAEEAWTDGFRADPGHYLTWEPEVTGRLRSKGLLEPVVEDLRRRAADRPDDAHAQFAFGAALETTGRGKDAVSAYVRAVELTPDAPRPRLRLAIAALSGGQWDLAYEQYRTVRALSPDSPVLHIMFGDALARRGELVAALGAYDEALSLQPGRQGLPWTRALILYRLGRVEEAVPVFERVQLRAPRFVTAPFLLGLARLRNGEIDTAVQALERTLVVDENHLAARLHLGYAYLGSGRYEAGRDMLLAYYERAGWTRAWTYPEDRYVADVRDLTEIARLHPPVPGATPPDLDTRSLILVAQLAYEVSCFRLALDAFTRAFEAEPALAAELGPYADPYHQQACAALAAGLLASGRGSEADLLDDEGRALWRGRALEWLLQDLETWKAALARGEAELVRRGTEALLLDVDAAPLREIDLVNRLPEGERAAWHAVWQELRALHDRAE